MSSLAVRHYNGGKFRSLPFILQLHADNAAERGRHDWLIFLFDEGTRNIHQPSSVLHSVVAHANSGCVCPEGLLAGSTAKWRIDSQQAAD